MSVYPKASSAILRSGHLNIGAGRIVFQDLPRIDLAIENRELQSNRELKLFIEKLKSSNGTCHILGLMSPGGVHAHQNHIMELCRILDSNAIPVCVHGFLDGRDTPPQSAAQYVQEFERSISDYSSLSARNSLRPLLCNGSRQEVGTGRKSLSFALGRPGRGNGWNDRRNRKELREKYWR